MYTKYLVDVSKFLKYETFNFWEVLIFSPLLGGGSLLIPSTRAEGIYPEHQNFFVTFYQVMKTFVSFLPGYQFFLTNP